MFAINGCQLASGDCSHSFLVHHCSRSAMSTKLLAFDGQQYKRKKKESLERKDESGNKIILTFSPLSLSAISALSEPESLYFLFPRRSHRIFHRCPLTPIQDVSFRFPIQQHDDEYYPRAYRLLAILNGLRSRRCAVGHLLSDHWASTYSIVSELGLWVAFSLSSGASKEH